MSACPRCATVGPHYCQSANLPPVYVPPAPHGRLWHAGQALLSFGLLAALAAPIVAVLPV